MTVDCFGVIDSEEADEYASIDHGGPALDEEDGIGLVGDYVTEELEEHYWRRGSGLGRRSLGQVLSIKPMLNSRRIRTRLNQGKYCSWHG